MKCGVRIADYVSSRNSEEIEKIETNSIIDAVLKAASECEEDEVPDVTFQNGELQIVVRKIDAREMCYGWCF